MPADATPRDGLRVATYNTRDFLDDHRLAARVVRAVDPDVLCLQEVPRRLFGHHRLLRFAAACGLRPSGRHTGSGGTTVLTSDRVRLLRATHHRLPVRWPDRTRGFAVAVVAVPGVGELTAVSVHLGLRPAERQVHAAQVLATVATDGPLVLAGDLNEGEDGAAYRLLTAGGLRVVAPSAATYPAGAPRRRLDVVLASPELAVRPEREVCLPEAAWARASDHRPAWADLELV